ncbi:hypothetical protein acsn021_22480 [Anaerocolumna cellulosilytica]|uniref:Uncharacterized protein n=1 Tax=Anaerocolumna cellulosilytica TaxID=433286 RepID=A0A6S6R057_9FIRM|nr:phenylacetate--CoA ligase family protein [Anaerocolumna cellulosilytica]MBB5194105.1 phenylacetate-CoA ligase [Anaerocolumna cellulosilytica]BCJ94679.1 hypothetical protein acsn021_22480 [Anaerocolumna cellulosilytica]
MTGNKILLKMYAVCPIFLQNIFISIYGLLLYGQRYGKTYRRYLNYYTSHRPSDLKKEKYRQNKQFINLLHYAIMNSPFYQEFYKNIDISKIKTIEDIALLPILTKTCLKENLEKIYTVSRKKSQCHYTGGTTGIPMAVRKRKQDVERRMAYLDAYKRSYGFINLKMRSARFFGKNIIPVSSNKKVFWRKNYFLKQRLYSTYYLKQENLSYYITDLNRFKPQSIDGFVSSIYTIAKYIDDNHLSLNFTPKAIFTTAETVLPYQKELIERVFSCPLSDQYASNEGAPFIIQCREGYYHEALDTGVFEHIKTPEGVKLLVTSFDSYGTPLIRYDIGDYIQESPAVECSCGSCFPIIGGIIGRDTNYLVTKGRGNITPVQLSVLIAELPLSIEQVQFLQKSKDLIVIRCSAKAPFSKEAYNKIILEKVRAYLGEDIRYKILWENALDRAPSGKFQLIVNQMKNH